MTIIEAITACMAKPGEVAARRESYEDLGAFMFRDGTWHEWNYGLAGGMTWNPLGPLFAVYEIVDDDGEPREYVTMTVADVEGATR